MTNDQIIDELKHLNGTRYVPSVRAYIQEMSGRALVLGPGDMHTHDFNAQRIHIIVDEQRILGLHFS
ncbi:hypothetical protein KSS93_02595 [Pseudomonas xanthosomatis]|uniref:Peptidase inhibitor I78 family protein n=1 Tax=Pseudomonas fakonensis TaxID=2842355 RepID=A0ABX8N6G4_9PSED|nr:MULTISPECIES: I78 family peptidase inhibitor [Pseudomonas]QXH46830.1 hypothetical protein KSS93_02595 [Pseudomonas xanthosomatis]QXH51435.1 hypothetical protein KSS94_26480 [Pseudomonas fakonensis]